MTRTTRVIAGLLVAAWGVLAGGAVKPLLERPQAKEASRSNPYQGQERAAKAGAKLFHYECSACHGSTAEGTSTAPSLVSPAIRSAPPGAIFWVLRNGGLRRGMPSFAHLPDQQRWQIVTYLKALSKN